ncbi:hypothetical protein V8G54_029666 [Vigna mungo]|uniref:Uncharacterized protein n=1 Tax=Vigna mungo TaxID=3915 RepID=A0AAQ3MV36_VIGMU
MCGCRVRKAKASFVNVFGSSFHNVKSEGHAVCGTGPPLCVWISNHTTVPSHRENKKEIKFTFTSQSSSTAAPETPFPSTEPVRHSRAHLPTSTRRRSALRLKPNLRRTGRGGCGLILELNKDSVVDFGNWKSWCSCGLYLFGTMVAWGCYFWDCWVGSKVNWL